MVEEPVKTRVVVTVTAKVAMTVSAIVTKRMQPDSSGHIHVS